ncbi:MAG: SdpI family protein [Candidatus Aenigmarchaeota archaeon]|nr:SdpI family protein [Candidatus Aenigmarchaeota archaeon]
MRKSEIAVLIIILVSFIIGIYIYPQMPETMASHWNIRGEVDGYISKFWGIFLMPFISFALFLLFVVIPRVDPLKENIVKFRKYFDGFIVLLELFLFYLYLFTIFWSYGFRFNIIQVLIPAFAILFFYVGILVEKSKRNWFIGIRTPWTMSSDKVWEKTNKLGGKLFKITGIIILIGIFFADYAFYFFILPVIIVAIYTVVYSYFEYKKQKNHK